MSNVIDFLEQLGRDASLRYRARDEIEQLLTDAGIDPALRDAFVSGDSSTLERLLGAKTDMCCLIHAPGDDDEGGEDEQDCGNDDAVGAARERAHC
jgi:hypothetical protein